MSTVLSPIEEIIEEARNGRMFILVDDEDRENEGDLVIPAQMATPEAVNFMAKHGRGLICLTLSRERVEHLGLKLMAHDNLSRHQTAFTVSIEAREGVTTGISAHDRARTISVAIDGSKGPDDIGSPGHVFPLVARDGGVLVRAGHTEASVDIARLAGLNPSGVICEIMNDDGTMARLPDLVTFAREHGLKVAAIKDLIAYRLRHDNLVSCIVETPVTRRSGHTWMAKVYANRADGVEHVAYVLGDISPSKPALVRMHVFNPFEDLMDEDSPRTGQLQASLDMIEAAGVGAVVFIRTEKKTITSEFFEARNAKLAGKAGPQSHALRDYGIGAQILLDLGVRDIILLSNTESQVIGLQGYGLNISERKAITTP